MNAGAAAAQGDVLLFLHADTRLPENADRAGARWPRAFGPRLGPLRRAHRRRRPAARWSPSMMNLRSRLTGIATGDQAMFVTRAAFDAAGGFPPIALMEDVALSARLKRVSRPLCLARARDHLGAALAGSTARCAPSC